MTKPVATMILQRNLPEVTNALGDHILKWNGDLTDLYVIESGSDDDKLSKFIDVTFHANWDEAKEKGMHFPRGFNYGLLELAKTGKEYDHVLMVMGDTQLANEPTIQILLEEMRRYPNIGIITPISKYWGDVAPIIGSRTTKAHWLLPHVCWLFRKNYIDLVVAENNDNTHIGHFYDGTNLRGYDTDTELILKAYRNDMCFCVTDKASHHEISDLTAKNYERMKTEQFETHLKLMFNEGLDWLKSKYGFDGKHPMRELVQREYLAFFDRHLELQELRL